jgi:hypothetical protein
MVLCEWCNKRQGFEIKKLIIDKDNIDGILDSLTDIGTLFKFMELCKKFPINFEELNNEDSQIVIEEGYGYYICNECLDELENDIQLEDIYYGIPFKGDY